MNSDGSEAEELVNLIKRVGNAVEKIREIWPGSGPVTITCKGKARREVVEGSNPSLGQGLLRNRHE